MGRLIGAAAPPGCLRRTVSSVTCCLMVWVHPQKGIVQFACVYWTACPDRRQVDTVTGHTWLPARFRRAPALKRMAFAPLGRKRGALVAATAGAVLLLAVFAATCTAAVPAGTSVRDKFNRLRAEAGLPPVGRPPKVTPPATAPGAPAAPSLVAPGRPVIEYFELEYGDTCAPIYPDGAQLPEALTMSAGGSLTTTPAELFVFDELGETISFCISWDGSMSGCSWTRVKSYLEEECGPNNEYECSPDEILSISGYYYSYDRIQVPSGPGLKTATLWVKNAAGAVDKATDSVTFVQYDAAPKATVVINNGANEMWGPIEVTLTREAGQEWPLSYAVVQAVSEPSNSSVLPEYPPAYVRFPKESPSVNTVSDYIKTDATVGMVIRVEVWVYDVCGAGSPSNAPAAVQRLTVTNPPSGLIVNNGEAAPTSNPLVVLNITDPEPGATKMCVSELSGPCTTWVPLTPGFTFTLAAADNDGVFRYIYVHQALDNGTEVGNPLVGSVFLDNVKPRIIGFLEETYDQCTTDANESTVWYNIADGGADRLADGVFTGCVTTDPTGADCTWVEFQNSIANHVLFHPEDWVVFSVPPGDGPKVIYAFAKDAAGNVASESGTVELITTPLTGSLLIDDGAAVTYQPFVNVMFVPPLVSGLYGFQVAFVPNKTFAFTPTSSDYADYKSSEEGYVVALPKDTPPGTKITIYAWVYSWCADTPNNAPLVGSIIFGDGPPSTPQIQIRVGGVVAPAQTPTSEVDLLITAPAGSKITQMCIWNSNDYSACALAGFKTFASPVPWTLAPGVGERKVYVWLRDEKGRDSETPAVAAVTVDPKAATIAVKGSPKFDTDGTVDLTLVAVAKEMCISEKDDAAKCSPWERYAKEKIGFKLAGSKAERNIYAFFRNTDDDTPWKAGPAKVTYDKVVPKMNKGDLALKATYTNGTYTLTFAVAGASDTTSGVDTQGFLVAHNTNKKTPKPKCVDGDLLPVTYAAGKGSVAVEIKDTDFALNKFRVCAKVRKKNRKESNNRGGTFWKQDKSNKLGTKERIEGRKEGRKGKKGY
ncbi:MAG: hypothetical protein J3K34DRAFT_460191 [Monoraphidium minutum]|nr:MAG: hypothetical protein J3K34DRAFT_460191 [Monoraphidium minutum]